MYVDAEGSDRVAPNINGFHHMGSRRTTDIMFSGLSTKDDHQVRSLGVAHRHLVHILTLVPVNRSLGSSWGAPMANRYLAWRA